ncbi:SDR family NAD(P)-dependent oxidoreductase [Mycolicibacterium sp. P1-5]|uniref:SDR family NAD(P)-dependent oxidoreductase n=1 Tax=Mycolicibacterium sp. P1-5 TaxID=2024617 RepID=UPI0011ED599A|nr:SDR family NAD(P)-dependent oxidoreductase [Mycolicibacterium sp. P1-5]KAA0107710.1 SDR family NAD(P)-dependent oxidoreductase [Mycolicibacterium sp. P1-5]
MTQLRFDGRTAIVTGAGGNPSIGRAHALLLAARGANVIVNDIGRTVAPGYAGVASADEVAAEIRAAGGNAVADSHSVATEGGARGIVQTAIDTFGRLDILINNAGISIAAEFDEMTADDIRQHIDINLMGTIWTCRAAWPHMKAQGYGRIVNTSSGAFGGVPLLAAYSASKGGVFSFSRALAGEGSAHGIKVNTLNPGAFSRMVAAQQTDTSSMYQLCKVNLPADLVAPVAAWLSHEDCPSTGETITAVGGEVARVHIAQTSGFTDKPLTLEAVAERWKDVLAGAPNGLIPFAANDPREWEMKPYIAAERF